MIRVAVNNPNDLSRQLNDAVPFGSEYVEIQSGAIDLTNLNGITIPNGGNILSNLFTQLGTYSVVVWLYQRTTGISRNVWGFNGGGSNRHALVINEGSIGFQRYNGSAYTGKVYNGGILNQWTNIICENEGGVMRLFQDGQEVGGSGNNYSVSNIGNTITIGYRGNTNGSGGIDGLVNIAIFNRVLTQPEKEKIYNNGPYAYSSIDSGLIGQWSGRDYEGIPSKPTVINDVNKIDKSEFINWASLSITKNLTSLVDVGSFQILKVQDGYSPEINQEVEIYKDDDKIFGGYITGIKEDLSVVDGGYYSISFQDYIYELSGILVAKSFENKTGKEIIDELFTEFAPSFNTDNVVCNTVINKIVFNNAYLSDCLTRISKIIGYEWYIDQNKNVYFFQRFSLVAPFNLTDTNGNYVYKSLRRTIDATQIANQVKVRGGLGTETSTFEDVITVSGDETRTFKLPYKFANLQVWLDTGGGYVEKNVGIDNIDDFTTDDVLYNYQSDSIRFENSLDTGTLIKFAGNKKYPVMAIVSDDLSIALIGLREKYIVDNSLVDATTSRERAFLELDLAKEAITDCSFSTYQEGLETGMRITINSELRDISELDFIINKVVFKTRTPEDFEYAITCSTARKMGLTEFLKELAMRGDTFEEEENAVAEIVKTDRQNIEIDETIEKIGAYEIEEELEIEELVQDTEVEPIWVLAPYTPTSINDTKRPGRLDLSMKLY